jgi:hypothetical protein
MVKDSKTTDSLFKGQKVTAIKSEQGLREGETYTVLGEEFILKQIIGEGNATVYKLQDSSGNVIVIENPEGLFYEVKDVKAKDSKTKDTQRELLAKLAEKAGDKEYADDVRSGKVPSSMIAERINYYQTKVGDSEESESLKVKIGDIKKNMDAARKMGYDTEPYQKEIDKLETKDYSRSEQAYDEGYKAAKNGKPISDNPFKDRSRSGWGDLKESWDDGWKSGKLDSKATDSKTKDDNQVVQIYRGVEILYDDAHGIYWCKYKGKTLTFEDNDLGRLKKKIDDYFEETEDSKTKGAGLNKRGFTPKPHFMPNGDLIDEYGNKIGHYENTSSPEAREAYKKVIRALVAKNPEDSWLLKSIGDSKTKDAVMECMECGKKFKKNLTSSTFEVKCPNCGGYDVDVISDDAVSNHLPSGLDSMLQDFAQIYGKFNYSDIMNFKPTDAQISRLKQIFNEYQRLGGKNEESDRRGNRYSQEISEMMKTEDSADVYTKDPLTKKGQKILEAMKKIYGEEKGEQVFYASKNKGTISGVDSKSKNGPSINDPAIRNQIRVALQTLKMPSAMLGVMGGTTKEQAKEILKEYDIPFTEDSKDAGVGRIVRTVDDGLTVMFRRKGVYEPFRIDATNKREFLEKVKKEAEKRGLNYHDYNDVQFLQTGHKWVTDFKSKEQAKEILRKYGVKFEDSKMKDWLDPEARVLSEKVLRKMKEIHKRTKQTNIYDLFDDAIRGLGITGKIKEDVRILILQGANHRYTEEFIFKDSKTKDQEIKITIGEDPVNPSPAEQKVESNDVIYKEHTLKQLPETGEFEIYAPDGSIVGHAKALELAKLFVDRIVASLVSDAKTKDVMSERRA